MGRVMRAISFCLALALLTGCAAEAVPPVPADPTVATTVTTASTASVTAAQTTTTESTATTTAKTTTVPATTTETTTTGSKVTTTTKTTTANTITTTKTFVTVTYTTRSKPTTHTIPTTTKAPNPTPGPYGPIEGTVPLEQGLTFGGKTYRYAYRGVSMSDREAARIAEFEKTYHVKLEVYCYPADEYLAGTLSAMMSGKPYDILRFSGQDYPTSIVMNLMTPLEDYITTADLYDEKAPEKGGFSVSALKMSMYNGYLYGVSGVYAMDPVVLLYNKRLFSENDLLTAACKNGEVSTEWTWDRLHPLLLAAQDRDNGVWGLASDFMGYIPSVLNSYGTNAVKTYTYNRVPTHNLNDPLVYEAFETVQKYYCDEDQVVDPMIVLGSDVENFLISGAAAAVLRFSAYDEIRKLMEQNTYTAFGSKEEQFANVGIAPLPNFVTAQVMSDCVGYGAGNGATKQGILCALAFAKHEAVAAYRTSSAGPSWLHKAIGSDHLYAPLEFPCEGTSSTVVVRLMAQAVAKGQNITVVLKGYEKSLQSIIDNATA